MLVSLSKPQQCSMKYCMCYLASVNQMVLVSHQLSDRMTYLGDFEGEDDSLWSLLLPWGIRWGWIFLSLYKHLLCLAKMQPSDPKWFNGFHHLRSTRKVCSTQNCFPRFSLWIFLILLPPLVQVSDKVRSPGFSFTPLWPFLALKLEQLAVSFTSWISFCCVIMAHKGSLTVFMLITGFI